MQLIADIANEIKIGVLIDTSCILPYNGESTSEIGQRRRVGVAPGASRLKVFTGT
jgi:hypothetical protein